MAATAINFLEFRFYCLFEAISILQYRPVDVNSRMVTIMVHGSRVFFTFFFVRFRVLIFEFVLMIFFFIYFQKDVFQAEEYTD